MTKAIFTFITALLLLTPIISMFGGVSLEWQLMVCLPFLLLLGIPHGAIDHVLYRKRHCIANGPFIGRYLLVVGANIVLWMLFPPAAYAAFLFLSAFHFGQSQFSHYNVHRHRFFPLLQLTWGLTVLSGLVAFNWGEVQATLQAYPDFQGLSIVHHPEATLAISILSLSITVAFLISLVKNAYVSLSDALMEFLVLGLILVGFYLLPLVIGFTLFFVILHAFKVLQEEYEVLRTDGTVRSPLQFVRMVTPFTLFSIAGIALAFAAIYLHVFPFSYGYGLLIIISSITLPHAFVMNRFYDELFDPLSMKQQL